MFYYILWPFFVNVCNSLWCFFGIVMNDRFCTLHSKCLRIFFEHATTTVLLLTVTVLFSGCCLHIYRLHTHTRLTAFCPGLPGWAGTRKIKPIWILLKQKTVTGSGISWAICKPAPCSKQTTTPPLSFCIKNDAKICFSFQAVRQFQKHLRKVLVWFFCFLYSTVWPSVERLEQCCVLCSRWLCGIWTWWWRDFVNLDTIISVCRCWRC